MLPRELSYSLESHSIAFLFSASSLVQTGDKRASHGHLDFLLPLYRKVTPDHHLAVATSWLAVSAMRIYQGRRPYLFETQLKAKLIRRLLVAVNDPGEITTDETLMALILAGYGEHLLDQTFRLEHICTVHQQGAEALVRKRGWLNFQSQISRAMFNAVRHNAVGVATRDSTSTRNWDLWSIHYYDHQLCDSYSLATELDACGVAMITIKGRLSCKDLAGKSSLQADLSNLLLRLHAWQYHVPNEWVSPQTIRAVAMNYPPEVCHLYNQWYLLRLEVSHLKKELDASDNIDVALGQDYSCELELIGDIISSEHSLLGRQEANENPKSLSMPEQVGMADTNLPRATIRQCRASPLGSRLLGMALERLEQVTSDVLRSLKLPHAVATRYREVTHWARREQQTLGLAFPATER